MSTFLFSLVSLAIAKCLLTFMVADTLYIDAMKTFSVDIVVLLVISREFRPHIQQRQEILREYKILLSFLHIRHVSKAT